MKVFLWVAVLSGFLMFSCCGGVFVVALLNPRPRTTTTAPPTTTTADKEDNTPVLLHGGNKNVNVKGYYTKNGTYVAPHVRKGR